MATQGPNSTSVATGTGYTIQITGSVGTGTGTLSTAMSASGGTAGGFGYGVNFPSSNPLNCTGFGFSIPGGSTINGIQVEERVQTGGVTADVLTTKAELIKGGVTQTGTNRASNNPWQNVFTYLSFGGSSDLWGNTWTSSDINASNFGVLFDCTGGTNFKESGNAQIDHVRITITYTSGGVTATQSGFLTKMI